MTITIGRELLVILAAVAFALEAFGVSGKNIIHSWMNLGFCFLTIALLIIK